MSSPQGAGRLLREGERAPCKRGLSTARLHSVTWLYVASSACFIMEIWREVGGSLFGHSPGVHARALLSHTLYMIYMVTIAQGCMPCPAVSHASSLALPGANSHRSSTSAMGANGGGAAGDGEEVKRGWLHRRFCVSLCLSLCLSLRVSLLLSPCAYLDIIHTDIHICIHVRMHIHI